MTDRSRKDRNRTQEEKPRSTSGNSGKKQSRSRNSKRVIFNRTVFLMIVFGCIIFIPLIHALWQISVVDHEKYQQMATKQQTKDMAVSAARGDIYDRNGNVMAMSATVYDLIVSPRDLVISVDKKDFTDEEKNFDEAGYQAAITAKQDKVIKDLLAMIPDLDPDKLEEQVKDTDKAYKLIKKQIDEEHASGIRDYMEENKTAKYLYLQSGTKRYYPYGSLAAQALGFVNTEGGAYGIEAIYDSVLKGQEGRIVTTKTARGTEMYDSYSEYIDATDGLDLTLTIDSTIQSYLEKTLEEGIQEYDVRNGAFGIAMDPKTGAVLGIASSPKFDPNNYGQITDPLLLKNMDAEVQANYNAMKAKNAELKDNDPDKLTNDEVMQKAKAKAYSDAANTQWRSKAIDSRYEPGSTFKALVLAAAFEEGVVSENDTFYCAGHVRVPGWDKNIDCSKREGHGQQTLAQAVQNSCNPAFIEIGSRLGIDKYQDYFEAFGLKDKTGIDLPGEASLKGNIWDRDKMSNVDLAVGSFGQRIEVTPIQMITALSAVVNGGNLMQPYVVQSVSDKNGTVVSSTEPSVVRQVVSRQTSDRVVKILESVVSEGTGKNAYVAGYRIGGKTGSSQTGEKGRTIVSFVGFAPADDPQVIVLLAYDKPQEQSPGSKYSTTGVYISGGNMAAPKVGPLIANILDYMGVEKKYTQEESAAVDVQTPALIGRTVGDVDKILSKKNLKYRTVGQGDVIHNQIPAPSAHVPGGSTVVLYVGDAKPEENGTVPNVVGQGYEAARKLLENAGFFMRASGVSVYYGNATTANGQSVAAGETAPIGTVIDVSLSNVV